MLNGRERNLDKSHEKFFWFARINGARHFINQMEFLNANSVFDA